MKFIENINLGTAHKIGNINNGAEFSATKLSTSRVFVAYAKTSSRYLYGVVCTISGTTITKGLVTALSSSAYIGNNGLSAVKLSSNKVFIAYNANVSALMLYGVVCTISGTTITKGVETELNPAKTGYVVSAVLLETNKVMITYSYGFYNYLTQTICKMSGTTITVDIEKIYDNIPITTYYISAVALSSNSVFVAYNYGDDFYGIISNNENYVTNITSSSDKIGRCSRNISFSRFKSSGIYTSIKYRRKLIMKYILVDSNNKIIHISTTKGYQENGNILIDEDTSYPQAIPPHFVKEIYEVDTIPEGVCENKYCYTEEKGFYENADYVEPVNEQTEMQALKEQITDLQLALAELVEGGI